MPPVATQDPDSVALRAAVLSFGKKPPSPSSLARTSSFSTSAPLSQNPQDGDIPLHTRRSAAKVRDGAPTNSRSSSSMASQITSPRSSPAKEDADQEAILPVRLRRKLFLNEDGNGTSAPTDLPPPRCTRTMMPDRQRSTSPERGRVDSSSLDDISSLRSMFEQGPKPLKKPAVIESPRASNPSLTAAVLATQLSPPSSSSPGSSGKSSSNRGAPPSSDRRSPAHRKAQSDAGPGLHPPVAQTPRSKPPVAKKPAILSSQSSRESVASVASLSDVRSIALTAATIAHTSALSSPARSPQTTGTQVPKAPQPPPPRRTRVPAIDPPSSTNEPPTSVPIKPPPPPVQLRKQPNISASTPPLPSHTATPPPPLPSRTPGQVSPAKTAAVISNASLSRKSSFTLLTASRTGDDASIIAASLAPSRAQAPGPRKPPVAPIPPPPRRRRSLPALPKPMLKETLRPPKPRTPSPKPPRNLVRKGGHHAEALKHQWRWVITPKERRRYEGLWAANRGLLLPPRQREFVINIVVRDIWRRSRLDFRTLGEIWELVDRGRKGCLSREEFCVGTWLVDMALRGGKVPVKVEEGVWESIRSLVPASSVFPVEKRGRR